MTIKELSEVRFNYLSKNWKYQFKYWTDFNYQILENCIYRKSHKFKDKSYNDITIMIDTETSKSEPIQRDEYYDIYTDILNTKFKWDSEFKYVASKKELAQAGLKFTGNTRIDVYYENLKEGYPWIFKEECYSDVQALEELYGFMANNVPEEECKHNYVIVWTLSIRMFDLNICTLYGRKPTELCQCIEKILAELKGITTYMYIFNLSYDYVFLRKFLFDSFGFPIKELNVKPHYPISLEFSNGLILKDALILAQRKLEKWAKDLEVEHQKAVGDFDYNKIRHQNTPLTKEELHYAEYDTLAGVECLDKLKNQLNKDMGTIPLTSTGILRELIRKVGSQNKARDWFNQNCPTWEQYQKLVKIYHGGYVHGNRHHLNELIKGNIMGFDFSSSYPYVLFFKYPSGKFQTIGNKSIDFILEYSKDYAFMFKLIAYKVELKNDNIAMPYLQYSKCKTINDITDNGRIIASDYIEIYLNEIDLSIIKEQYNIKASICTEVEVTIKDYLPRWFTDIVFDLYKDKCTLKGVDNVLYTIQKYKLNACYGLCCQRWDKVEIMETEEGEYIEADDKTPEEIFNIHIKKRSTILPYSIGVWCTSYACQNLFNLGSMCETWHYSDTDSCYGLNWNMDKVNEYNQGCIDFIKLRGYSGIEHNGNTYHLGIAENEDDTNYTEFKYQGAKRYAGRCVSDNEIHITVAGVPKKKGAKCLKNDINNFDTGFIFDGITTGKLTHTHFYIDDIYINKYGDEVGDSIDLTPCDYKLDTVTYKSLDDYIYQSEDVLIDMPDDYEDIEIIRGLRK